MAPSGHAKEDASTKSKAAPSTGDTRSRLGRAAGNLRIINSSADALSHAMRPGVCVCGN